MNCDAVQTARIKPIETYISGSLLDFPTAVVAEGGGDDGGGDDMIYYYSLSVLKGYKL
jgi:hypothetical protein